MEKLFFEENDTDGLFEKQVNLLKEYLSYYTRQYDLNVIVNYFYDFLKKSILETYDTAQYKAMSDRGILCVNAGSMIAVSIWKKKFSLNMTQQFDADLKKESLKDFISEGTLEKIVEELLKVNNGNKNITTTKISLFLRNKNSHVFPEGIIRDMASHVDSNDFRRAIALNGFHKVSEYVESVSQKLSVQKNSDGNGSYSLKVKNKNGDKIFYSYQHYKK